MSLYTFFFCLCARSVNFRSGKTSEKFWLESFSWILNSDKERMIDWLISNFFPLTECSTFCCCCSFSIHFELIFLERVWKSSSSLHTSEKNQLSILSIFLPQQLVEAVTCLADLNQLPKTFGSGSSLALYSYLSFQEVWCVCLFININCPSKGGRRRRKRWLAIKTTHTQTLDNNNAGTSHRIHNDQTKKTMFEHCHQVEPHRLLFYCNLNESWPG